ncbi:tetratricopeptide repeat protein [Paenibacillus koleovorans]|uniref:tetratricopeptide repeat protein n=1 Tax=Paenibacillus koleovorans TaxID=121608 RepID=UPI000FD8DBA2|nr:tetratricopeptide repeat protein [Paenibacillus koleovorans]
MIKQLFETMNDVLEEIAMKYSTAGPAHKQELNQKWNALKSMSDHLVEEWLKFEEKMGKIGEGMQHKPQPPQLAHPELAAVGAEPGYQSEIFNRGQGYFELLMFDQAIAEFEQVVKQYPDFLLGRLYLAMGLMRNGSDAEAYRHLKLIISLSDTGSMRAIAYNAMGCIQAKNDNLEQSQEYFRLAHQNDPSCSQPMLNWEACASAAHKSQMVH